jgi:hypothetical protein
LHILLFLLHAVLRNQTSAVSLFILNGGPALLACKPVMLLVRHLLQHKFRLGALVAFEFANLVVIVIIVMVGHLLACVVVRCCALLCVMQLL